MLVYSRLLGTLKLVKVNFLSPQIGSVAEISLSALKITEVVNPDPVAVLTIVKSFFSPAPTIMLDYGDYSSHTV